MKRSVFILILVFGVPASASFFSYTQTITTKQNIPKNLPPGASADYKRNNQQGPRVNKVYVHGAKMANTGKHHTSVMDFSTGKSIQVDHDQKTYTIADMKDTFSNPMMGMGMQYNMKYQDLKKSKTVSGKKCSLVRASLEGDGMSTFMQPSTHCFWMNPPSVYITHTNAVMNYFKKLKKSGKMKIDMDFKSRWTSGLNIYSVSEFGAGMGVPTRSIVKASNFSTKKFSTSIFSPPKGYKKNKAPKQQKMSKQDMKKMKEAMEMMKKMQKQRPQ